MCICFSWKRRIFTNWLTGKETKSLISMYIFGLLKSLQGFILKKSKDNTIRTKPFWGFLSFTLFAKVRSIEMTHKDRRIIFIMLPRINYLEPKWIGISIGESSESYHFFLHREVHQIDGEISKPRFSVCGVIDFESYYIFNGTTTQH